MALHIREQDATAHKGEQQWVSPVRDFCSSKYLCNHRDYLTQKLCAGVPVDNQKSGLRSSPALVPRLYMRSFESLRPSHVELWPSLVCSQVIDFCMYAGRKLASSFEYT